MPHKTFINGTNYGVSGRKICVNGTNFSVNNGKALVDSTNKNINFKIVAPPWNSGDANAIMAALDAYHNGSNVDFSSWNIGDQRPITIDGSTYQLTFAHKFSGMPSSSTAPYAFNGKQQYPAYAVVCIPQNGWTMYMDSNQFQLYFNGTLHTYCNSTQYNKIKNTDVGQCFKSFQCYVGKECTVSDQGNYGTYNQSITLASLAMKEIGLSSNNTDENNALIAFSYFDSSSKRRIRDNGDYYWLRSPYYFYGNYYSWLVFTTTGSSYYGKVNTNRDVVWFGCI